MSRPLEPHDACIVIVKQFLMRGHVVGDDFQTRYKVIKPACEISPLANGSTRVPLMSFRHILHS